jgi:hypothetical protein
MTPSAPARRSRFWLYAPFVLLALIAAGWSGFWFVVRGRVADAVDGALAREAGLGRDWTCRDRSITGFPFRVELRCAALTLASSRWGGTVRLETGPALALGQIYSPGLVILQVAGPLKGALPESRSLELGWKQLEASLEHNGIEPHLLSLVVAEPSGTLTAPGEPPATWRANRFEAYARKNPTRPASEQAVDLAISAKGSVLPVLDALVGATDPGDVDIQATVTQAEPFRIGFNPDALEAWRNAGGQFELTKMSSVKGRSRVEATGRLLLDQTHRISGQVQAGIAGIDQIGGVRIGGLMGGLGALLGGGRNVPSQPGAAPALMNLPPLVIREGRFYMGPVRLPLQPLAPLY